MGRVPGDTRWCSRAGFWSQVTGYHEDPENTNHPDDPEGLLLAPDGSRQPAVHQGARG